MEATIERLRASKQQEEEQDRPEFVQAGRDWAMQDAEYSQLKLLADAEELKDGEDLWLDIIARVFGDDLLTEGDINAFMEAAGFDTGENTSHFQMLCWLEGVRQVWQKVGHRV